MVWRRTLVPEYIERLAPYEPGKPLWEVEEELGLRDVAKLASNENPLGPSPKALRAMMAAVAEVHRYPDASGTRLKRRLAATLHVGEEQIVLGNGANELVELVVRTFLRPGEEAVMAQPSFVVYETITQAAGGVPVKVPTTNFTHDLPAMARHVGPRARLAFIANPNNPTGTMVTRAKLEAFLEAVPPGLLVCLDEAYGDYAPPGDFADGLRYVAQGRSVIVLRTFSKIYGLAGIRVGYGVAIPEIAGAMEKIRQPFNVNHVAQAGALAALDDEDHVRRAREVNATGLDYLYDEFQDLGLEYVPSVANFVLVRMPTDAAKVFDELLKEGVIVRPMNPYGLPEYVRVTVGTEEENQRFVVALRKVLSL